MAKFSRLIAPIVFVLALQPLACTTPLPGSRPIQTRAAGKPVSFAMLEDYDKGDDYLGLLHTDGTKKLAFATVDLITDLLDTGTLVVADQEAHVTVTAGAAGDLHHHLFVRPDGKQVLFVYDKRAAPTVDVSLQRPGRRAIAYALDGTAAVYPAFDGTTLSNIALSPGEVAIFVVEP